MTRVVVYTAEGCTLCEPAIEIVREVCGDGFRVVDIAGDPGLEATHRSSIPVVEIDGKVAFTYFVQADALRERLG